jgi:hypothetical protein
MLIALALIPLIPYLVMLFYRHPLFLLSLFPLSNLITVFLPDYYAQVGPFQFLIMDPVYFFTIVHLGLYALRRPRNIVRILKKNIFLSMFLAMVAVYVALYTPVYGQSAIGEARKYYFIFLIPLLAAVSIKQPEDLRRFILVIIFSAICVAVFALARGAMQGSVVRIVNAQATLIVAFAAFSLIVHRIYRMVVINPILDRILLLVFSVIVVLSAQRSVWLGVGFGLILALWLYRSRSTVVAKVVMAAFVILLWLITGLALFPDRASGLMKHFQGILDPSGDVTASWRMEGWQRHLDDLRKENRLLFGEGLGGYYATRTTGGADPHNAYVQMVLKFGLFGLIMYALLTFQFFHKTLTVRKKLRPGPMRAYVDMGVLNFGAAHAFLLGYGLMPIILVFFAVATAATKLSQMLLRDARYPVGTSSEPRNLLLSRSSLSRRADPRPIIVQH